MRRVLERDRVMMGFGWIASGIFFFAIFLASYEANELLEGEAIWRNIAVIASINTMIWFYIGSRVEKLDGCLRQAVTNGFFTGLGWTLPALACDNFKPNWTLNWAGLLISFVFGVGVAYAANHVSKFLASWVQSC